MQYETYAIVIKTIEISQKANSEKSCPSPLNALVLVMANYNTPRL